ncbi:MAG TPA: hypothetical protein VGG06_08650 [Thermoanaerobaculia bacterium]
MFSTEPSFVGLSEYADNLANQPVTESYSRIYVEFEVKGGERPFLGLLDCGAQYCVLAREVVDEIKDRLTEPLGWRTFQTAFGRARGQLFPYEITLIATEGEALNVEVIAFICPDWPGPTYLGYTGVLDRIQWAVHPGVNGFFFGPLVS